MRRLRNDLFRVKVEMTSKPAISCTVGPVDDIATEQARNVLGERHEPAKSHACASSDTGLVKGGV
ncbi:hypothetical protein [uncultured Methylovirgula sp.]|uniref:hypothetical protein n=1 Tax=uncultured Methylovirgula sp. TaxID=1285960 RepID=UPI0026386699|nr:hypothetical protein [uncultured Methylovirgula sp.]